MKQLPKNQTPVRVTARDTEAGYVRREFELVTPERLYQLHLFHAKMKDLCDAFGVDLVASTEGDFIEVIERGFRYPDGFSYSATMKTHRRIAIEKTWFDEVPVREAKS